MGAEFLDPGGIIVPQASLTLRRAREIVAALCGPGASFARFVECRSSSAVEIVVFDVDVERPQIVANDIQRTERLAVSFAGDDQSCPEVLALRHDFPITQHQNQRPEELPRSLCLYDRPWSDVRLTWAAPTFIERVRWWLRQAARDELHADDQGLEPLLLVWKKWLVLPAAQDTPNPIEPFVVSLPDVEGRVLLSHDTDAEGPIPGKHFVVIRFEAPKQCYRVMPRIPRTLADLAAIISREGFDFLAELRERLKAWPKDRERDLQLATILLIDLPKIRRVDGPVEMVERRAVLTTTTLMDLGAAVGVWSLLDGKRAVLIAPDLAKTGQEIRLDLLNVCGALTRDFAAQLNGHQSAGDLEVFAIGAGALGSQVAMNLARAGWGSWTIVDDDDLLPHNLARHAVSGPLLGFRKASALALEMNALYQNTNMASGMSVDMLRPGEAEARVREAATAADLILDMSASLAVARHVASMVAPGRRASLFLSPSGNDLILLGEDAKRSVTLDDVEMSYYVGVATEERLRSHLAVESAHVRYGLSCRDVSSRIPQDSIATLAGIGAAALRRLMKDEQGCIRIWRLDPATLEVSSVNIPIELPATQTHTDWTLRIAPSVLRFVARERSDNLPRETGGVLLGRVDHDRRIVHLMLALPSPSDSQEWPTQYIRGCQELRKQVEGIQEITGMNLRYLGEWHSHPDDASTTRSPDDKKVYSWIAEHTLAEGNPPVMLIAGDRKQARVFIGDDREVDVLVAE